MEPFLVPAEHPDHNGHGAVTNGSEPRDATLDADLLAETQEELSLPAYSVRGSEPGERGCWALNKRGEACAAPRRGDGDYCSAHSGLGVAGDPKRWSEIGVARSAVSRRRRADLRLAIGISRSNTPRGVLKAAAFVNAERLAARAIDAALDPTVPSAQAGRMALDLIREVDPPVTATISTPLPTDPEGVSKLSLSQLLSLGESMGIDPSLADTGS